MKQNKMERRRRIIQEKLINIFLCIKEPKERTKSVALANYSKDQEAIIISSLL